jgi:serine/threonine-protein kinase HipA
MNKNCLYCYRELDSTTESDFHEQCSLSFFGTAKPPLLPYSFDQMAELAKDVVERSVAVPGVQPKLSLSLVNDVMKDGHAGRLTVVGALGGNYIFKPPSIDFPELPANEHVTMRIAESFGIRTVESSLIRLQSGELSYITKRIDRTNTGEKIHMLDMFQILEAVDKYKSSMEKIGKALGAYSNNTLLNKLYFFELSLFSFLTGNNDMHLKNFSMIRSGNTWSLAPAYDLLNVTLANPEDSDELALTLEGKKKKITLEIFERFGRSMELNQKQIDGVFKRFLSYKPIAMRWLDRSFLSDESRVSYKTILEERYNRIGKSN